MIPRDYQIELAEEGYEILRKYMICYFACEERTGKTLAAILTADMCETVNNVLVVTKKNAIDGWTETLSSYDHKKVYRVTNYHQVHKMNKPDLLILDESHNYISGCPKQPTIHKKMMPIAEGVPIIYLSATPHGQGYQMLYHQLSLSSWSPWSTYKNFYNWFNHYGVPKTVYVNQKERNVYTETQEKLVRSCVDHLFITKTRKELDFKHEPKDKLHYIELDDATKAVYNELTKHRIVELKDTTLVADTPMKFRASLHQLEGGAVKSNNQYYVLRNNEKIDYIKATWGDTEDLVIYYNYIAEGTKLREAFKHAKILQATSNAEGIDLVDFETIVIYSQDFSASRHTQRRARQAAQSRDTAIIVHYLLVKNAASEKVYTSVSINKVNFIDSVFEEL